MPYYDRATGIELFKDDICHSCDVIDICNVYSDLTILQKESRFDQKHITRPNEGLGRENYLECQMYVPHVPMAERPDPDPNFGLRISEQESFDTP